VLNNLRLIVQSLLLLLN